MEDYTVGMTGTEKAPLPAPGTPASAALAALSGGMPSMVFGAPAPGPGRSLGELSRVLMLLNMVKPEELGGMSADEFSDILLDVREECAKYGKVLKVVVPRPPADGQAAPEAAKLPAEDGDGLLALTCARHDVLAHEGICADGRFGKGVGRIFVLFDSLSGAQAAQAVLHGRSFNENRVEATYYKEELFNAGTLDAPLP